MAALPRARRARLRASILRVGRLCTRHRYGDHLTDALGWEQLRCSQQLHGVGERLSVPSRPLVTPALLA